MNPSTQTGVNRNDPWSIIPVPPAWLLWRFEVPPKDWSQPATESCWDNNTGSFLGTWDSSEGHLALEVSLTTLPNFLRWLCSLGYFSPPSFLFSFTRGQTCIVVSQHSQSHLVPFPFSLQGISSNIIACSIQSWWLILGGLRLAQQIK